MKKQKRRLNEKIYRDPIAELVMEDVNKLLKEYEEERERELAPYRTYWREMLKEYKAQKVENGKQ